MLQLFYQTALAASLLAFCLAAHSAPPPMGKPAPRVTWVFKTCEDRAGNPHSTAFLLTGGKRVVVLRGVVDAFTVVSKQDYPSHGVPAGAVAACAGWWAGQGVDLYAVQRGDRLIVFCRQLDEETPVPAYTRLKSVPR